MKCDTPFFVKPGKASPTEVPVPCGRCPPCKRRRVNGWVFRLMQEEKRSSSAHFVTLTYHSSSVPISKNGFLTLQKSDMQKFFKRLRKICPNTIKYYAVGEYGSKTKRPHYHAIIFNSMNIENYYKAWSLNGQQIGDIHVGQVSDNSVAYTMKYIDKNTFRPNHARDDRAKEFAIMSKHLGDNYITPQSIKYHKADLSRLYLTKQGGYLIAMPKYYRDRIYNDDEQKEQLHLIQKAVNVNEVLNLREFEQYYANTPYTYIEYLEDQKWGRVRSFNQQISNQRNTL